MTAVFALTHRSQISVLCSALTAQLSRSVSAQYGETECGQHWAALCIDAAPANNWKESEPLVTIVVGTSIEGPAAVQGRDGSQLADGIEFSEAIKVARRAALQTVLGFI